MYNFLYLKDCFQKKAVSLQCPKHDEYDYKKHLCWG